MENFTKWSALVATKNETEYKTNPLLAISSVGTEIKKNSSQMPDGSALLTDTGKNSSLKSQGISYIIHAVPRQRSSSSSDEEFIELAAKAAQNSIILADRTGINKLAICLLAGKIYLGTCDPNKLAEGIIMGSLNQLENCRNLQEVIFVDYDGDYYQNAYDKIKQKANYSEKAKKARVVRGDICQKSLHGAEAIVNSENAGMGWGGGISGEICKALSSESGNVDKQRKELMNKFNSQINNNSQEPKDNNNSKKISVLVRLDTADNDNPQDNGILYYLFVSEDGKYQIKIDVLNSATNIRGGVPKKYKSGSKETRWYKLFWKESESDKRRFEKDDFIEIEEQADTGNQAPNQNDNSHSPNNNHDAPAQNPKNTDNDDKQKQTNQDQQERENDDKNEKPDEWRISLKTIDNSLEEVFSDEKVKEWKKQKGFNNANKCKELLKAVQNDTKFLAEIENRHNAKNLKSLLANKSPKEVIIIIKRWEYEKSANKTQQEKEIRKFYSLKGNQVLTEEKINNYLYKKAIGEIKENSPSTNEKTPKASNLPKIIGISAIILVLFSLVLAILIRKRKRLSR